MIKHNEYLLVTVKEGSSSFIDNVFGYLRFRMYINFKEIPFQQDIKLPEGSWQLIGLAAELTEEQWREIVDKDEDGCYKNYNWKSWHSDSTCDTATESGQSLLRSHNLTANQTVIIKEIKK